MKKIILSLSVLGILLTVSSANANPTLSLSLLTNIAKITAGNCPLVGSYFTNLTAGTMYGGSMSFAGAPATAIQAINNFGVIKWTINMTNYGNAIANFRIFVIASNTNRGGATAAWDHRFPNDNATVISNFTLAPFGTIAIPFVITNVSPAANGAWMSYELKLTNLSAQVTAKTYKGSDGITWYGGSLGVQTNHARTNAKPEVFMQYAGLRSAWTNASGYLTVLVSGPVLQIVKTVVSVTHPSGLSYAAGYAEPGAYIRYRIWVTNKGSASATNTKIRDLLATNFLTFVSNSTANTNFQYDLGGSLPTTRYIAFTNNGKSLNFTGALSRGVIYYTVKVR